MNTITTKTYYRYMKQGSELFKNICPDPRFHWKKMAPLTLGFTIDTITDTETLPAKNNTETISRYRHGISRSSRYTVKNRVYRETTVKHFIPRKPNTHTPKHPIVTTVKPRVGARAREDR